MVENDWLELFHATVDRRLKSVSLRKKLGAAVCVVMTAKGYPGDYEKGKIIEGLEAVGVMKDVMVFHAGTSRVSPSAPPQTAGGRVLGVTALGVDLEAARHQAYEAVRAIRFDGAHYRKDIGAKALKKLGV
jgi:phosphoribosylamine--glycine ligase